MKTLNVEAKVQNLKQVLSFIDEELRQENCSKKIALQIEVAVEELFVNIAHYAYINDTGERVFEDLRAAISQNRFVVGYRILPLT